MRIDAGETAKELANYLAPLLPSLLRGLEDQAARAAGAAWAKMKEIWGTLRPALESKPAAKEAAEDVAKDPENDDLRIALAVQIRKVLAENEGLTADLQHLLADARPVLSQVTASGAGAIAAGGAVSGSTFVTGSGNVVGTGKTPAGAAPMKGAAKRMKGANKRKR